MMGITSQCFHSPFLLLPTVSWVCLFHSSLWRLLPVESAPSQDQECEPESRWLYPEKKTDHSPVLVPAHQLFPVYGVLQAGMEARRMFQEAGKAGYSQRDVTSLSRLQRQCRFHSHR